MTRPELTLEVLEEVLPYWREQRLAENRAIEEMWIRMEAGVRLQELEKWFAQYM